MKEHITMTDAASEGYVQVDASAATDNSITDDEESLVKQDKTTTTPKLQRWHLRGPV